MRGKLAVFAILAGCAGSLPRLQMIPAKANESCHVKTWEIRAKGLSLPDVPLTLRTEQESGHLAGSLLGDWGRLLAGFKLDTDCLYIRRPWFSGVGLGAGELAGLAVGLSDPVLLRAGLGPGWTLLGNDTEDVLLQHGKIHSVWSVPTKVRRWVRDGRGTWRVDARLVEEQLLPPGSCRGR